MNAPNVHQLPRAPQAITELESKVAGAMLNLGLTLSEFEAIGLAREDFSIDLISKAWAIARKRAERREPVTAETVGSAGLRGGWFSGDQVRQLEVLAGTSTLTLEAFRAAADDLRTMVRGARLAASLEAEVRQIRSGQWSPGKTAQYLEGLASQLQRDTAPDEDATGDVVELLNSWDTNEKTGKSRLLPTRIAVLDAEIGGLPPGLTVIASSPGVGKTAVLDSMIRAQLTADPELHLGFFGLEDGTSHVARRWMAHDTGMLLREVGWKQRTAEQRAASELAAERYHPLLSRLHVYRHDTISASELIARIAGMRARYGIAGCYVDNLTEVDVAPGRGGDKFEKEFQAVAELGRRLRNLGLREELPIGLLAHTIGALLPGEIPTPNHLAGGQALARRMRLFFGLWAKGEEIRCTTGKSNELGPAGTTVAFARLKTAALIDPTAGEKINLQQERAIEKATKAKEKLAEQEAAAELRSARRAAKKAEADAKKAKETQPPVQSALLDVPPMEKPNAKGE